jgi:ElaB/YqjD/DUF883 family membrane-anchored ribosome-binding protein
MIHSKNQAIEYNLYEKGEIDQIVSTITGHVDNVSGRANVRFNGIDYRITDEVSGLNVRIDDEVETLNERIDQVSGDLSEQISGEVSGLNVRIDSEVETLNTRIDSEVSGLNSRIDDEVATINAHDSIQDQQIMDADASIATNAAAIVVLEGRATSLENRETITEAKNVEQDGRLDLIEAKNTEQDTRLDQHDTELERLDDRIDQVSGDLSTQISGEVSGLNARIDTEVETINDRIDQVSGDLSSQITGEVSGLNSRIDDEVSGLNVRIDDEVETINDRIDQVSGDLSAQISGEVAALDNSVVFASMPSGRSVNLDQSISGIKTFVSQLVVPAKDLVPAPGQADSTTEYATEKQVAEVIPNAFPYDLANDTHKVVDSIYVDFLLPQPTKNLGNGAYFDIRNHNVLSHERYESDYALTSKTLDFVVTQGVPIGSNPDHLAENVNLEIPVISGAWSNPVNDHNIPSEKLVKDTLDEKVDEAHIRISNNSKRQVLTDIIPSSDSLVNALFTIEASEAETGENLVDEISLALQNGLNVGLTNKDFTLSLPALNNNSVTTKSLTITEGFNFSGSGIINDGFTSLGPVDIQNELQVRDEAELGSLHVLGASNLDGSVTFGDSISIAGTLDVSGTTTLRNDLTVTGTGNATFKNNVRIEKKFVFLDGGNISGAVSFDTTHPQVPAKSNVPQQSDAKSTEYATELQLFNSWNNVVHTFGDEVIGGEKNFTDHIYTDHLGTSRNKHDVINYATTDLLTIGNNNDPLELRSRNQAGGELEPYHIKERFENDHIEYIANMSDLHHLAGVAVITKLDSRFPELTVDQSISGHKTFQDPVTLEEELGVTGQATFSLDPIIPSKYNEAISGNSVYAATESQVFLKVSKDSIRKTNGKRLVLTDVEASTEYNMSSFSFYSSDIENAGVNFEEVFTLKVENELDITQSGNDITISDSRLGDRLNTEENRASTEEQRLDLAKIEKVAIRETNGVRQVLTDLVPTTVGKFVTFTEYSSNVVDGSDLQDIFILGVGDELEVTQTDSTIIITANELRDRLTNETTRAIIAEETENQRASVAEATELLRASEEEKRLDNAKVEKTDLGWVVKTIDSVADGVDSVLITNISKNLVDNTEKTKTLKVDVTGGITLVHGGTGDDSTAVIDASGKIDKESIRNDGTGDRLILNRIEPTIDSDTSATFTGFTSDADTGATADEVITTITVENGLKITGTPADIHINALEIVTAIEDEETRAIAAEAAIQTNLNDLDNIDLIWT